MMRLRNASPGFAGTVMVIGLVCAAALYLPGETVTAKYLNDVFIFLDGAHRMAEGQIPNRDFHSALGPLVYAVPALGYVLSGDWGAAMPAGMALLVVAFIPLTIAVIGPRLGPVIAIAFAVFLILVLATPVNTGESMRELSFAMFYNRVGWAATSLLFVMHLAPARERGPWLDACCAAAIVLVMLFMKATYGLVGLAFIGLAALDPAHRAWAVRAFLLIVASALGVAALWGGAPGHIGDLALASRVSGGMGGLDSWLQLILRNLPEIALFALFSGIASWSTRRARDGLFFAFCLASGLALLAQNFQQSGIVVLGAGAAVAAELTVRAGGEKRTDRVWLAAGMPLLVVGFLLPAIVQNAAALGLHAALAATGRGDAVPLPRYDRMRLVALWSDDHYPAFARYLDTLADGSRALRRLEVAAGRLLVLDFVDPFTAGLGLAPSRGDSTWFHWGRTLDDANVPDAETLFRDIAIVMDPKDPIESWTAEGMRRVYAQTIASRYVLATETAHWRIYVSRALLDGTPETDLQSRLPPGPAASGG